MTRAELVARLHSARFERVSETRLQEFVDEAARELTLEELWGWRRATESGASPLTVTALGQVDTVIDTERRSIWPRRRSELVEAGYDLEDSGQALYYHVAGDVVATYPVAPAITVHHFSAKAWTTGTDSADSDADTPRAPERWHDLIELIARRKAATFDRQHEYAAQLRADIEDRLEHMRQAELPGYDEPDVIRCGEFY